MRFQTFLDKTSGSTRPRRGLHAIGLLLLGSLASTAQAAPTFSPDPSSVELAPGGTLTVTVSPGSDEQITSIAWSGGSGTATLSSDGVGTAVLTVPSSDQNCSTIRDTIVVSYQNCLDGYCTRQTPVRQSVLVTVNDPLKASPTSTSIQGAPGSVHSIPVSVSGGRTPYQAISSNNASVSLSNGVLTYTIPSGATSDYRDTIKIQGATTVADCSNNAADITINVTVAVPVGTGLSANPSDISLNTTSEIDRSNQVTKSFAVSGGAAPYSLSVVGVSGGIVGAVAPARLTSAGTAQYTVTIPANAQSDLTFVNRILVTDAQGNSVSINVQANVTSANPLSSLPGLTPNQRSVARTVETVCPRLAAMPQRTADQEDLLVQCSNMISNARAAGIPDTLQQVTNENANAAKTAGISTGTQQMANLVSRLAALRTGSKGIDVGSFTLNTGGQNLSGSQLAALKAASAGGGASADSTLGRWGFFLNGTLDFGDRDKTKNETGFDYNSTAVTGGADYRFNEKFIAGAAFGYGANNVNFDTQDGGLDTETWHLAAYATSYLTERAYVDAIVEYGWNDYESKRNIDYQITSTLDAVSRQAQATFSGTQFGASLGTGYDINQGPVALGVYGKLGYLGVNVDDYRERNAGGLNLAMNGFDATSVTTTLGVRVSRVFNTATAVLVPQAKIEWEHEYDNDASTLTARFAADPSATTFAILTDDPDRDYFRLGIGLSAVFPHGVSSYVNYSTLLDKQDWSDNLIDVGVRLEF